MKWICKEEENLEKDAMIMDKIYDIIYQKIVKVIKYLAKLKKTKPILVINYMSVCQ